jgi:DNA-binding transcriptional ArsR family regulator
MSRPPEGIDEILVTGLGSPTKLRILMLLAKSRDPLSRYIVDTRAFVNDRDAVKALKTLVELGWVLELPVKPVKYQLNRDNAIVGRLVEFFSFHSSIYRSIDEELK